MDVSAFVTLTVPFLVDAAKQIYEGSLANMGENLLEKVRNLFKHEDDQELWKAFQDAPEIMHQALSFRLQQLAKKDPKAAQEIEELVCNMQEAKANATYQASVGENATNTTILQGVNIGGNYTNTQTTHPKDT